MYRYRITNISSFFVKMDPRSNFSYFLVFLCRSLVGHTIGPYKGAGFYYGESKITQIHLRQIRTFSNKGIYGDVTKI